VYDSQISSGEAYERVRAYCLQRHQVSWLVTVTATKQALLGQVFNDLAHKDYSVRLYIDNTAQRLAMQAPPPIYDSSRTSDKLR
jgi:hypothetical protein